MSSLGFPVSKPKFSDRFIPGIGPKDAKIAIVGEAPGKEEDSVGEPFVGSSGKLLKDMLLRVGINFNNCYVTNVVKYRPQSNNFALLYKDAKKTKPNDYLQLWQNALIKELREISPNIIIALGNEPLQALTGKKGITKWRGSIVSSPAGKTIGTYHPAMILRKYEYRSISEHDLKRALEESTSPTLDLPSVDCIVEPSFAEAMDYLRTKHSRLSFDYETSGSLARVIGLAASSRQAICIPFMSSGVREGSKVISLEDSITANNYWTEEEERSILDEIFRLMTSEEVEKVAQNFPFDSVIQMVNFGIPVNNLWMDTMVAQHCCYSELPKSLDFLCSFYTRVPRYSDYEPSSDRSTWIYNCHDAAVTFEVALALEMEMRDLGVEDFYREVAHPCMLALCRTGYRGVSINKEAVKRRKKIAEESKSKALKSLESSVGRPVNPNSPKQVKELLFRDLALPPQISRKTGKETTDAETIEKLILKHPDFKKFLQPILDYRDAVKTLSFLEMKLDSRGKMVTSFNATGTKTGRISSSKTALGFGSNLQQQPRGEFREIYVADSGKVLVKADLSQAEIRVVAGIAGIEDLLRNFKNPDFDIHRWNASLIFSKPIEEISKKERQQAKHCLHSANYKGGPGTAQKHAKVPYRVAKVALEKYIRAIPDLSRWWEETEDKIRSTRKLTTPYGRLRVFLGRMDQTTFRSGIAQVPQSTVGDHINICLSILDSDLPKIDPDAFPILQVHDEIVCEVPNNPEVIRACGNKIKETLESPISIEDREIIIPTEVLVGKSWAPSSLIPLETYIERNFNG